MILSTGRCIEKRAGEILQPTIMSDMHFQLAQLLFQKMSMAKGSKEIGSFFIMDGYHPEPISGATMRK